MSDATVDRALGVALIGYGLAGRAFHAPFVGVTPGLQLRAAVSRDAAKVHADLPGIAVEPSVEAVLARDDIDLVVVCSPDETHADHASAALGAGKHVVVDKPFATTLDDARRVAAAASASDRVLAVFHNRRWDADFLTLRRLIDDGSLGEVVELESRFDRWRPAPAATWKEARDGGVWFDLGAHLVDQALVLFGMPQAVSADLARLRPGTPAIDYAHVVLHYPQRRVVLHASKLAAAHGLRFAAHGTRGSWIKHGTDPQEAATLAGRSPAGEAWGEDGVWGILTDAAGRSTPVENSRGDYRRFWTALVAAIRGDGANPVPAGQAVQVMAVLHAGLVSAQEARVVTMAEVIGG